MERIVQLLFVTTSVWLFSVLLIYAFTAASGNGGEYWGFDGTMEPFRQAQSEYERGNYILLGVDQTDHLNSKHQKIPKPFICRSISGTMATTIVVGKDSILHGPDSVRLALQYADGFNRAMTRLMNSRFGYSCVTGELR